MRSAFILLVTSLAVTPIHAEPLPDTKPLTTEGDLAARMVAGIDKYLMRELEASVEKRKDLWKLDLSSRKAAEKSVEPNRERLKKVLGVVDARVPAIELEYVATAGQPSLIAETEDYKIYAVRWPVLEGVDAEGLLLEPKGKLVASAVALPDADMTPEMLAGLAPGVPEHAQFARRLAENGCRVLVPTLIDRKDTCSGNPKLGRATNQPHREFVYRMAFEMGRHVIGYELQKVMAAVDWLTRQKDHTHVGVIGYGEGATLAFYAGALDPRIRTTVVIGAFGPREKVWQEPIYHNVWGLLREFGDSEVALLYNPFRVLQIDYAEGPRVEGPPPPAQGRSGAAPGRLVSVDYETMSAELQRWKLGSDFSIRGIRTPGIWAGNDSCLGQILSEDPQQIKPRKNSGKLPADSRKSFDPTPRQKRQFDQLVAFTQKLMRDSEAERAKTFWASLEFHGTGRYAVNIGSFRKQLWEEVIGKLPAPTEAMNPQTRLIYDEPKWKGYEVTLDLYPDVFAYGILLLPKDLKPGEKRPVVVCQHGLEGKPADVCNPKEKTKYYNSFGAQLADKGYIVFAPQNPYIGQDKFRVLQRKANPLGLSLFSFIIRQHERTLDWLATLPNVDAEKMAFYGLSYGGKTAMRVPAILPRYCLSICSGDFNEWTWKNVSVDFKGSYMFTGEYEMPEFNMGHTMVYAEMAALIAPRPFMVERGHDDPVGIDEWVAYEYAKVRRNYSRLKLADRTEIEFFPGGHEINGKGTFAFLQKHLGYPK